MVRRRKHWGWGYEDEQPSAQDRARAPHAWGASHRDVVRGLCGRFDHAPIGSEGILGVITEAWVRVRPRPGHHVSRAVRFDSFALGAHALLAP